MMTKGRAMRIDLLAGVLLTSFTVTALAGDLPSRYAPPPVLPAGPGTKVGVLSCNIAPSIGLIVVGMQRLSCRFSPDAAAPQEFYSGSLDTVGIDLGFTAGGVLTWGVFAPTNRMMPGSLAGTYVGPSGNVGVGVGVGSNFLLGGSENTVALQPWSVEGTVGVNASAGLSNMELRAE
jgi:hypothetical protein